MLQKRAVGSLEITTVGIGCNNFGRELDAAATRDVVHAALDAGVTFFDTADNYGKPKTTSETLLGEMLENHRNDVVIATKFGRWLDPEHGGGKPAYVRAATEASLRRLRTDRIDLMQMHIPDPETPIEETLGALGELVAEGKIREIGCSNFSAEQLRAANAAAAANGLPRFISAQEQYSLLHRAPAAELIAECVSSGVSLMPWRPLFNGLLTGKYSPGAPIPEDSRIGAKAAEQRDRLLSPANLAIVARLTEFAEARGHTILELAFAWLLAHPFVPTVIAGVSSPRQVQSNVAAAGWVLDAADVAALAKLLDEAA